MLRCAFNFLQVHPPNAPKAVGWNFTLVDQPAKGLVANPQGVSGVAYGDQVTALRFSQQFTHDASPSRRRQSAQYSQLLQAQSLLSKYCQCGHQLAELHQMLKQYLYHSKLLECQQF